jgi:adenylate cyclase
MVSERMQRRLAAILAADVAGYSRLTSTAEEDTVRGAIEIQRRMVERNSNVPEDKRIEFRIGVNIGDVIIDSGDIFGNGVNVAVRLEGIADPGGICVSRRVQEFAQDQLEVLFEDAGEQELKKYPSTVPGAQGQL